MSLIAEQTTSTSDAQETRPYADERREIATAGKVTHVLLAALANYKVPNLTHKKVKAEGRVPRILVLRSRSIEIGEEPEAIQPPSPELIAVEKEQQPQFAPIEELPAAPAIKLVPTPRRMRIRKPKQEEKVAAPVPAPKPLKVIRRRREETPKVFETIARSFPKAMLEGIDIESEENNHRQID